MEFIGTDTPQSAARCHAAFYALSYAKYSDVNYLNILVNKYYLNTLTVCKGQVYKCLLMTGELTFRPRAYGVDTLV